MATYTDNYQLTLPTYAETADIATINNNMTKIDEIMHDSQISIATAYDASTTSANPYNTGDIVMYEKIAYKCKYDGVYGTWDASKWEQTTLADNLGGGDASEISYDNTTSGLTADDVQEAIDELEGNIEDVSDGLDDAVESLAPAYDSTQTYDEGDIVSYQNKLYECNTDNTTGTWNAQYWDEYIISENMGASVSIIPETIEEPKRKVADYTIDGVSGSIYQSTMAEQLDSETGETDTAPYLFRASPQLDIPYERMNMKVVGGTVAWNQLCNPSEWASSDADFVDGVKFTKNNNGSLTINISEGGATATRTYSLAPNGTFPNHVVYGGHIGISGISVCNGYSPSTTVMSDTVNKNIRIASGQWRPVVRVISGTAEGTYTIYPQLIDITQALGIAIADYVYTLEQATAGSGIAWLQSYGFLTKDYYAYNTGSLESVKTSALKTRGFNQWDGTYEANKRITSYITGALETSNGYNVTDYIKILPNTVYYKATSDSSRALYFDYNKNPIPQNSWTMPSNASTFTTPSNAYYVRFTVTTTYLPYFIINLHYDGERDGEYEAYSEHTYALDSDLELRGIPKLDSNNNLYYDGDVYESDGTVTRKYDIVDLGTLNWVYLSQRFRAVLNGASVPIYASAVPNAVTPMYPTYSANTNFGNLDKGLAIVSDASGRNLLIRDSAYTDAASFKVAMSGVYLVYELKTPTTETADAFQEPQIVDNWGTEEFVDTRDVPMPVGHDSLYLTDMRKKLERLPIIPPPSSDGTYVLVCTVASGKPSYSWETYTTTRSAKSEPQEESKEEPKEEEETKEEQR